MSRELESMSAAHYVLSELNREISDARIDEWGSILKLRDGSVLIAARECEEGEPGRDPLGYVQIPIGAALLGCALVGLLWFNLA